MLEQVSPALFAVGFVSLLAVGLATAALVTSLRSSPARAARERAEMLDALDSQSRQLTAVTSDNAAMRDEWHKHRVTVTELLDDAVTAMEQTERRRKSARNERRRAEEVRESEDPAASQPFMCPQCRYEHQPGETCMDCARRRFAM